MRPDSPTHGKHLTVIQIKCKQMLLVVTYTYLACVIDCVPSSNSAVVSNNSQQYTQI
jgi:hypothetical protein